MASEIAGNARKGRLGDYSIYPPFSCIVFLQGEKYSECCCKAEARDQKFALVNLVGFRREDVKVIDSRTNEELFV